jgi:hypothetical protein
VRAGEVGVSVYHADRPTCCLRGIDWLTGGRIDSWASASASASGGWV